MLYILQLKSQLYGKVIGPEIAEGCTELVCGMYNLYWLRFSMCLKSRSSIVNWIAQVVLSHGEMKLNRVGDVLEGKCT